MDLENMDILITLALTLYNRTGAEKQSEYDFLDGWMDEEKDYS